jgi:hypothetical protein
VINRYQNTIVKNAKNSEMPLKKTNESVLKARRRNPLIISGKGG